MASLDKRHKANGARLSQLLIDKGTEAMRNVFDGIHHPSNLTAVLTSNKSFLRKLPFINSSQREILFPSRTPSTSKDFDITLLYILLRNLCGLRPPVSTGSWDQNPPSTDTSTEANLARIKYYRNAVYGHITTTGIDDVNFQSHWNNISTALTSLGISHGDIKSLRYTPLDEDVCLNLIREWKEKEDKLESVMLNRLDRVESVVNQRLDILKEAVVKSQGEKDTQSKQTIIDGLAKCNVKGDILKLTKQFHEGSRKWLLDKVDNWFTDQESDSRVMILTAGPGFGKSVFAAKVCQVYQEKGLLAACHFCKFNYSDMRNPKTMLESLSSHMCDNVPGFKEKLGEQLQRHHSKVTITDAFRVLLNDPLYALVECEPMMIVIDALDESETNGKSELLDLIAKDFPELPECVKIFITSRPELPVREKLAHLNPVEIKPGDVNNEQDLEDFLGKRLSEVKLEEDTVRGLVRKCQGSFLFACHLVLSLKKQLKNEISEVVDVESCLPKSIGSVYREYFDRLRRELAPLFPGKPDKFDVILEILTAAEGPLPLSLVAEVLELPGATYQMKEVIREVNERLSALLLVFDDCLTVFHKSVVDWLLSRGYDEHSYTVDQTSGHRHLWLSCAKKLQTVIRYTNQSERQAKGNKYAERHGIDHLQRLTKPRTLIPPSSYLVPFDGDLRIDGICKISAERQGSPQEGCGWKFFQDNENEYVMTTKHIVNQIQSRYEESEPIVNMEFLSDNGTGENIVTKLRDSVVVSSDEGSLLDYAVIKYSGISSNGSSRRHYTISKLCQLPVGTDIACSNNYKGKGTIIPYPSDVIQFLKKQNRFHPTIQFSGRSSITLDHAYVDDIERNKDIFLFYNGSPYALYEASNHNNFYGFPLWASDLNVVGMLGFEIHIDETMTWWLLCSTAVRIDKIIKDIYRKIPELAKIIFPDFRDTC